MHFGRKKSSSRSSATTLPSLSHVFPISWLSKFKHIGSKSKLQSAKTKLKSKPVSPHPPFSPLMFKDTQFYDGDVEEAEDNAAFWQLSFGRDQTSSQVKSNYTSAVKSFWDDSEDDEVEVPLPSCRGCRPSSTEVGEREDNGKLINGTVSDIRKRRDIEDVKDRKFKNRKPTSNVQRVAKEGCLDPGKMSVKASEKSSGGETVEKNMVELEPIVTIRTPEKEFCSSKPLDSRKLNYIYSSNAENHDGRRRRTVKGGNHEFFCLNSKYPDHSLDEKHDEVETEVDSGGEAVRKAKIKELEKQRKSVYLSRELQKRRSRQSGKVRVYSPRTASKTEICKIRALEDLKKDKAKKIKARRVDKKPDLETFAMVKCSLDPRKDFRDSMMEMITENNIEQPEELENLLACYLSLNSDQYHNLIVKVFQEVWLEMNQFCSSPEIGSL